jgi:hypothetical protein
MLIRITLRLIIASIASLILTATIIAIRNFHLELWKSWRLGNDSSQMKPGSLADNLHFPDSENDQGDSRTGVLQADKTPDAQVLPLLSGNEGLLSNDKHHDIDFQDKIVSVCTADCGYSLIESGGQEAANPSIIPRWLSNDKWIVVAQPKNSNRQDPEGSQS